MYRLISRLRLGAIVPLLITFGLIPVSGPAYAEDTTPVSIAFNARVGDRPFLCGESYDGIGSTGARVTPTDFRLYVSSVTLISASGSRVPLALEQDGKWQFQNVALLDFENKEGPCSNGTSDTRTVVTGTVPSDVYTGVSFDLGIPFELNHQDSTTAASPLNLTALFWTWQSGYKFFRSDLLIAQPMNMGDMPAVSHGAGAGGHGASGNANGWAIHLGSTGCSGSGQMQAPGSCLNPNRPTVSFTTFDPSQDSVVVDLAALLAGVDVGINQPNTAFGCMSDPDDTDCSAIMRSFGLPFGDTAPSEQSLFRAQAAGDTHARTP